MGPKSFSAVMVRKTTVQSERYTKSNASVVLQWGFFQVVDWKTHNLKLTLVVVRKQRYFKSLPQLPTVNSGTQCYTVCDFTLH